MENITQACQSMSAMLSHLWGELSILLISLSKNICLVSLNSQLNIEVHLSTLFISPLKSTWSLDTQLNFEMHLSTLFILYRNRQIDHLTRFIHKKKRSFRNLLEDVLTRSSFLPLGFLLVSLKLDALIRQDLYTSPLLLSYSGEQKQS